MERLIFIIGFITLLDFSILKKLATGKRDKPVIYFNVHISTHFYWGFFPHLS